MLWTNEWVCLYYKYVCGCEETHFSLNKILVATNTLLNTLKPRQNGRYFPDNIFKSIFLNENVWILIKISLKFVPKDPVNNISALVQIMA